jgi:hypothetical protein
MSTQLPRGPEFERALLGTVDLDEPDPAALGRVARALGVGGVLLAPATASALGASSAATGGATAASAAPVALAGTALWLKPLLIGSVLGTLVSTTVHVARAPSPKEVVHVTNSPAPRRPEPPVAANLPAPRIEHPVATATSAALPSGVPAPGRVPVASGLRTESEPVRVPDALPTSVPREVEAIDRARDALRSGNPLLAIDAVEKYRREWPSGMLGIEATVLGIEARFAAGQSELAARQARDFLATHGDSRYAARLRALLASSRAPSEIKTDSGQH